MKKLLGILVLGLLWCNLSYPDSKNLFDDIGPPKEVSGICWYKAILEKQKPCDALKELRETLGSKFFDLIPRPSNVSEQDFRNLIYDRIQEAENRPENLKEKKEREEYYKNQADLHCSLLAGQAKSWLAGRKIYKSCMKAEGY